MSLLLSPEPFPHRADPNVHAQLCLGFAIVFLSFCVYGSIHGLPKGLWISTMDQCYGSDTYTWLRRDIDRLNPALCSEIYTPTFPVSSGKGMTRYVATYIGRYHLALGISQN